ncbi:hypothetical protein JCM10212_006919 [Sporobolomyces blumeae]
MLKAKAKAAATAAAQRRKAAAAAAAQQEAAAQQAQAAATGVGISQTRSGRSIRPNLTQFWADSASNLLAPGGSIQRIGYDQASFEEAYRVIAMGQEPSTAATENGNGAEAGPSRVGIIAEDDELKADDVDATKEAEPAFKLNKDDLGKITANLDVPRDVAAKSLRSHRGDVVATVRDLTGPLPHAVA